MDTDKIARRLSAEAAVRNDSTLVERLLVDDELRESASGELVDACADEFQRIIRGAGLTAADLFRMFKEQQARPETAVDKLERTVERLLEDLGPGSAPSI